MEPRNILFSPPDISDEEINEVTAALKSGWITTGPRTKELEKQLQDFCGSAGYVCLNSATAALECCLRALGIGPGDEVITSAYTYTASCSPICHVGATPVMCDVAEGSFEMDYDVLSSLITDKTKAIIPVDLGGCMVNYDKLFEVANAHKDLWSPLNDIQKCFDRVIIISDAAHSLGATYHGKHSGAVADFSSFSFHAVKNFTTAEGGGLAWVDNGFDNDEFYRQLMLLSLHGQTKDALSKNKKGAWEYDIAFPGYKCNMTDTLAALGLAQFKRYPGMLKRRREMIGMYEEGLKDMDLTFLPHYTDEGTSSGHLMIVHMNGKDVLFRNAVIEYMAEKGVATNVHYKPLPLLTAYANLGFDINDFPHAYAMYAGEITLPLHTLLSDDDVRYVIETFKEAYAAIDGEQN